MQRIRVAMTLVLAAGCGDGKVKSDAVDFGKVKSAVWMDRQLSTEAGDDFQHDMVLTDFGGWCKTAKDVYPKLGTAWNSVTDTIAADPSDATAICEAKRDFYTQAADLTSDLDRGFSMMTIQLRHPNTSPSEPPAIGSYDEAVFDPGLPYVAATIDTFESNPYRLYADAADCEGNPTFWEAEADDGMEDLHQYWLMVEGSATAEKPNPDTYDVTVDGTLEDRAKKPAGDVSAKGRFTHCEVSWDGDFPEFW